MADTTTTTPSPRETFLAGAKEILAAPANPAPAPDAAPPPPAPSAPTPRVKFGEPDAPAPTPEDELTAPIPEFKGQKSEDWKKLHEKARGHLQRAVAAEEALKRFREEAAKPYLSKIKELEESYEKADLELRRVAAERSPRLQKEFQARFDSIASQVSSLTPVDVREKVAALLSSPPSDARTSALEKVMESLSPLKQRAFADLVVRYDQVGEEKTAKIQESVANWEKDRTAQARALEARKAEIEQAFKTTSDGFVKRFTVEGADDFNRSVSDAVAAAQRDMFEEDVTPSRHSEIVIQSRLLPVISNLAVRQSEEIAALREELDRLKGASPSLGASGAPPDDAAAPNPYDEVKKFGTAGAAMAARAIREGVVFGQ